METITKQHPLTREAVQAVRFEVWAWREGLVCHAASPDLPGTLCKTRGSLAEASKVCFIRVCDAVTSAKNKGEAVGWGRWEPPVVGVPQIKRYSIA